MRKEIKQLLEKSKRKTTKEDNYSLSMSRYYQYKKKKKKKYKTPGGLGWGNPNFPGVAPAGESAGFSGGGDGGGGMGENVLRSVVRQMLMERHSMSKCMEKGCDKPPEVETVWANGYGRAWFCQKHFKEWSTKGDGKGEIVKQREIKSGKVGEKYGEED